MGVAVAITAGTLTTQLGGREVCVVQGYGPSDENSCVVGDAAVTHALAWLRLNLLRATYTIYDQ